MQFLPSALFLAAVLLAGSAQSAEAIKAFGPGGPAPAMKEAATVFSAARNIPVEVVAGPTKEWLNDAKEDGHLVFSGSEVMMTDFVMAMEGKIKEDTITPLYLRPSGILVRPGNPKAIQGFEDLLSRDLKVLVVNGAGQQGLWEDMAGRSGDISKVRALRSKIVVFAPNSAAARATWTKQPDIDVWIIWNIWQIANPTLADLVEVEPEYRIYRDTAIAFTAKGSSSPAAQEFVRFLQSPEGAAIFSKWGWIAN